MTRGRRTLRRAQPDARPEGKNKPRPCNLHRDPARVGSGYLEAQGQFDSQSQMLVLLDNFW